MEPETSSPRAARLRRTRVHGRGPGRAALAAVLVLGTASAVIQVPVVSAQESAPHAAGDISTLIRAVADATARLDSTREQIAVAREDVNKTLVDLQMARLELDRAIAEVDRTSAERQRAEAGV